MKDSAARYCNDMYHPNASTSSTGADAPRCTFQEPRLFIT